MRLAAAATVLLALVGCSMARLHRDLSEASNLGTLSGPVTTPSGSTAGVVVALFRKSGEGWLMEDADRLSSTVRSYVFMLEAAVEYAVVAFRDLDGDLVADPEEPAGFVGGLDPIVVKGGEHQRGHGIQLRAGDALAALDIDLSGFQQASFDSIPIAAGEIVSLDDERFSDERASAGMWSPLAAAREVGGGIYFLEAHDPRRIPVVFVHGIGGSPRDFGFLIAGLDRSRFEPWVCHYPSGVRLERATRLLAQLLASLQQQLAVERLFITAHSMGGLVARSIVAELETPAARAAVELLVTFSTPWNGHRAAAAGVKYAPVVVPSWVDVQPGSEFLNRLRRELPSEPPHHLFFGFQTGNNPLMPYSHDTVISVASQLDPWFQHRAVRTYGFDLDHVGILADEEVARTFHRILERAADDPDRAARRAEPLR